MAYEPHAGSVASKVIAHLKTLAPGEEIATGPLADAIGLETADTLNAFMTPAVNAGTVIRRNIPEKGRMNWWRLAAPARDAAMTPTPVQTPPPIRPLCPGCERPSCRVNGCVAERLERTAVPARGAAPSPAPAQTPTPTRAPAPNPTPAPTAAPTPMPTPAPTPSTTHVPEVPRFLDKRRKLEPENQAIADRIAKLQEFDAWYSVRTRCMRLVGVKVEADGSVLITREQLDMLCDAREEMRA